MLSVRSVIGTAAVIAVIAVILILVIVGMVKNKRAGKHSCSCGCSGCAYSGLCNGENKGSEGS